MLGKAFNKKIFTFWLLWLVIINAYAVIALNRYNLKVDTAYIWIDQNQFHQEQDWNPLQLHDRWDSVWYLDIAENGYSYRGPGTVSNIVFFPLYPFLIKIAALATWGNYELAGWLVSAVFLYFALLYFYKLAKEFHQKIDPYEPLLFLLAFPTAFFMSAIYTESLLLFLTLATFYYGRKNNFWIAGALGLFASLTKITGAFLFAAILYEYLRSEGFDFKKLASKKIIPVMIIPLGTLAFFTYHLTRFGDFMLFFKVQMDFGRKYFFNPDHFQFFSSPAVVNFALDAGFAVLAIIAIYLTFKKLSPAYGIYMILTVAAALGGGTLMSIGRYTMSLFPIFILVSMAKDKTYKMAWLFVSLLLLAMDITLFVNNYWAG